MGKKEIVKDFPCIKLRLRKKFLVSPLPQSSLHLLRSFQGRLWCNKPQVKGLIQASLVSRTVVPSTQWHPITQLLIWLWAGTEFGGMLWLTVSSQTLLVLSVLLRDAMTHMETASWQTELIEEQLCPCCDTPPRNVAVSTSATSCLLYDWRTQSCTAVASKAVLGRLQGTLPPEPWEDPWKKPIPPLLGAVFLTNTPLPSPFCFFLQTLAEPARKIFFSSFISNILSSREGSLRIWLPYEQSIFTTSWKKLSGLSNS